MESFGDDIAGQITGGANGDVYVLILPPDWHNRHVDVLGLAWLQLVIHKVISK